MSSPQPLLSQLPNHLPKPLTLVYSVAKSSPSTTTYSVTMSSPSNTTYSVAMSSPSNTTCSVTMSSPSTTNSYSCSWRVTSLNYQALLSSQAISNNYCMLTHPATQPLQQLTLLYHALISHLTHYYCTIIIIICYHVFCTTTITNRVVIELFTSKNRTRS